MVVMAKIATTWSSILPRLERLRSERVNFGQQEVECWHYEPGEYNADDKFVASTCPMT